MSPAEAAGYTPPTARDTGRYATDLDTKSADIAGPSTSRAAMRDVPGLPAITVHDATHYLSTTDLDQRPWLRPAENASPDAKRVIAAVDQTGGHHLQRHEGAAAGDAARERAELLRDPANPNAASRNRADDGFLTDPISADPLRHRCNAEATAISDPTPSLREGTPTDAVRPQSEKIDTFEGGRITIFFKPRADETGYEIRTLYPEPPDQ